MMNEKKGWPAKQKETPKVIHEEMENQSMANQVITDSTVGVQNPNPSDSTGQMSWAQRLDQGIEHDER